MKLNPYFLGVLILSAQALVSTQLFAATTEFSTASQNIVYDLQKEKITTTDEAYKAKCLDLLQKYIGIDTSAIKNVTYETKVITRQMRIEDDKLLLDDITKLHNDKRMSDQAYNEEIAEINKRKAATFDELIYTVNFTSKDNEEMGYTFAFNSETTQLIECFYSNCISYPNGVNITVSVDDVKKKCIKLISDTKMAGIENPVCIKAIPSEDVFLTFQDKNDASKQVVIDVDLTNGRILGLIIK